MSVDMNVSDLFFNMDLTHANRYDKKGQFEDFDKTVLREEAQVFLGYLARLGVTSCELPTADALVEDFLARV